MGSIHFIQKQCNELLYEACALAIYAGAEMNKKLVEWMPTAFDLAF